MAQNVGKYTLGLSTGVIGAGAGALSEVFQFRVADQTTTALLRMLSISVASNATGFAAGELFVDVIKSTGWTGNGTGGTAATLTGNKARTSWPATVLGTARIATTAALGAGTKTFDPHPIACATLGAPTTAYTSILLPTVLADVTDGLVFGFQEGFSVRVTVPATGTWKLAVSCFWDDGF